MASCWEQIIYGTGLGKAAETRVGNWSREVAIATGIWRSAAVFDIQVTSSTKSRRRERRGKKLVNYFGDKRDYRLSRR
jgi:hypothetical protein